MANNQRVGRVRQEILRAVTELLRTEISDPRVDGVTITDIELTGDLRYATLYYSTLSDDTSVNEDTQKGLDKASGLIRSGLGSRLTTYHTPEIRFIRDDSVAHGNRIDELLNQLRQDS